MILDFYTPSAATGAIGLTGPNAKVPPLYLKPILYMADTLDFKKYLKFR